MGWSATAAWRSVWDGVHDGRALSLLPVTQYGCLVCYLSEASIVVRDRIC